MVDRLQTEARYAGWEGSCRLLDAGTIVALEHKRDFYHLPPTAQETGSDTSRPAARALDCGERALT